MSNFRFQEYTTSGAFNLSLSRTQVAALHRIATGGDHYACAANPQLSGGHGARPSAQLKRFLAIQDILMGFSDGIDGDRLQAAMAWALDGKNNYQRQDLISLFAAPWVAAQEEAAWDGDAILQGEKDLDEITAVALKADPVEDFLAQVRAELTRARTLFPGDRIMTLAMAEEFGELVKAVLDEPAANVRKEAVQTAVMAARVVLDGDGSVNAWRAAKGLDPLTTGDAA